MMFSSPRSTAVSSTFQSDHYWANKRYHLKKVLIWVNRCICLWTQGRSEDWRARTWKSLFKSIKNTDRRGCKFFSSQATLLTKSLWMNRDWSSSTGTNGVRSTSSLRRLMLMARVRTQSTSISGRTHSSPPRTRKTKISQELLDRFHGTTRSSLWTLKARLWSTSSRRRVLTLSSRTSRKCSANEHFDIWWFGSNRTIIFVVILD